MADTWNRKPRPLAVCHFTDLDARFRAASDLYARTDDGGYPGTPAALRYRTEVDAVFAEAAERAATIIRLAFTGAR